MNRTIWRYFDALRHIVFLAILIVGGIIGYREYNDRRAEWRAERTLYFVQQANSGDILKNRVILANLWIKNQNILTKDISENREYRDKLMEIIDEGNAKKILTIFNLYESFSLCVRSQICSEDASLDMLGRQVTAFYRQWYPYVLYYCEKGDMGFSYNVDKFMRLYINRASDQEYRNVLRKWRENTGAENNMFCEKVLRPERQGKERASGEG